MNVYDGLKIPVNVAFRLDLYRRPKDKAQRLREKAQAVRAVQRALLAWDFSNRG